MNDMNHFAVSNTNYIEKIIPLFEKTFISEMVSSKARLTNIK